MYQYPDNLKAKASLALWNLKDIVILGICTLLSLGLFALTHLLQPLGLVGCLVFLSMRFDDKCILDYIKYAFKFVILDEQLFFWNMNNEN